jgi:hypothetical protein
MQNFRKLKGLCSPTDSFILPTGHFFRQYNTDFSREENIQLMLKLQQADKILEEELQKASLRGRKRKK